MRRRQKVGAEPTQKSNRLGNIATRTIAEAAPGFEQSVLARQVITLALDRTYGLTAHPGAGLDGRSGQLAAREIAASL